MKKTFAAAALLCLAFSLSALEVNKSELESSSKSAVIEFINYTGPHKIVSTAEAITGIGKNLGNVVSKSTDKNVKTGETDRYYIIHAVDAKDNSGKLDADILILGKNAGVDHIKNLRRIISGYLSSAYGYSREDSDTLAVFITVYNAVYRNKLDTFSEKYKKIVTDNLTSEKCGLSITYKDWPGNSQLVIPLYDAVKGGLSTVDTTIISDSSVVNSMKDDEDRNVQSRKDMVDLKEREAEEASAKAKDARKEAEKEQQKAEDEKAKTEKAKQDAQQAQKDADKAKADAEQAQKNAEENPDDIEAQKQAEEAAKEAEQAQENADQKQEEAEAQEEKQKEQEQKAEETKQEAEKQQALAEKKQEEAQSERREIAKDQSAVQKEETEKAKMPTEFGIILSDTENKLSRFVKFNKENGQVIKNSPVNVIRNRVIYKTDSGFVAIAGESSENQAIKLVILDTENLEISSESNEQIAADSVLVKDGNDFYCIIDDNGSFVLAKFGTDLSLKLKSDIQVLEATPVTVLDSQIVVTDSNGKIKVLDKKDLKAVSSN